MNPIFQIILQKAAEEASNHLGWKHFNPWINKQNRTTQIRVYTLFMVFMGWVGWWLFDNDSPGWIYSAVFCPIVLFYLIALIFYPDWLERRKLKIANAEKERNRLPEVCPTCRTFLDEGESGECKFCRQIKDQLKKRA